MRARGREALVWLDRLVVRAASRLGSIDRPRGPAQPTTGLRLPSLVLTALLAWLLCAIGALAEPVRIATWHGDFSRKGPGLLLREIVAEDAVAGLATLEAAQADVLLLTNFDFDAELVALRRLSDRLSAPYPHLFAARPNTGMPTGLDLDGDGRLGGPRDAQGYGWFSGQGGQAILSRFPLRLRADLSDLLWADLPGSRIAPDDPGAAVQRLSHSAHWAIDVALPSGPLTLLTLAATPPVFDGPEDRNGRRNADELRLWKTWLDGAVGAPGDGPWVLLGHANLDPDRGEGLRGEMADLLADPRFRDPQTGAESARFDRAGPLRLSYALPDSRLALAGAGTLPPEEGAGPHRLVWVDIAPN